MMMCFHSTFGPNIINVIWDTRNFIFIKANSFGCTLFLFISDWFY